MILALFDFDGTTTSKDSLSDFIRYTVGTPYYFIGLVKLFPLLSAYALKIIPNHIAKERLFAYFFKDFDAQRFQELAAEYSLEQIDRITRKKAIDKINWHQENGHKVVIVSASMECWIKPWCDKNGLDLISTRLEVKNKKLTGKFATLNCYGIEKANRVKEAYDLRHFEEIYAYGDSRGDRELLALADKAFYKPFRN